MDDQHRAITESITRALATSLDVHLNIQSDCLVITEDKAHRILNQYLDHVRQRTAWHAPAGILVTLLLTFASTRFQPLSIGPAVVVAREYWQALFTLVTLGTLVWLVIAVHRAITCPTLDEVVARLKAESGKPTSGTVGANTSSSVV